MTEKYDTLWTYLWCPSAEIANKLCFENLTLAPIGANVNRAGFIPLGLKSAFPQCFAPKTLNLRIQADAAEYMLQNI